MNNNNTGLSCKALQLTSFLPSSRPHNSYSETLVDIDRTHRDYSSPIDAAEREYRSRVQPHYHREEVRVTGTTVDGSSYRPGYKEPSRADHSTVDPPHYHRPAYHRESTVVDETVDAPSQPKSNKMGYHDDDGK